MEARMRAEVPEREAGEERHGAEPPLERDVERKAEDMSQMMGMFSKLVSSFVGAGNAEGIAQLAAVIERGQEGAAAAEEEWDEEEFHDADDGVVQMRESAANAIVCA